MVNGLERKGRRRTATFCHNRKHLTKLSVCYSIPFATSLSFGFILLNRDDVDADTIKHERGHNTQLKTAEERQQARKAKRNEKILHLTAKIEKLKIKDDD